MAKATQQQETSRALQNVRLPPKESTLALLHPQCHEANSCQSYFFTKLPWEIRVKIYQQAFGDRSFHINLHICAPECWARGRRHDSAEAQTTRSPSSMVKCHERYWWGSICNKSKSGSSTDSLCTDIDGAHFILDQNTPSKMTSIGVMGWLLSCRQAYAETVDILYSNTFHFAGNTPLSEFTRLAPHQNLACMEGLILNPVSLEISGGRAVGGNLDRSSGAGDLELITSIIGSGIFRNLRNLDVKIRDASGEGTTFANKADGQAQRILAIFDDLMPKMSWRFRRLQIYLEDVLYEAARKMTEISKKNLLKEGMTFEMPEIHGKNGFWRPNLDSSRRFSGYWVAQDNWRSQCISRITNSSPGSLSQGLRRLIKF